MRFEDSIDDVALVEAVGHVYSSFDYSADIFVFKSWDYFGGIEVFHSFSFFFLFGLLIDFSFFFDLKRLQFL